MVLGTLRALFSIEGALTALVLGALVLGGAHYAGVVDVGEVLPRDEWTGQDELEDTTLESFGPNDGSTTDELVTGELNDVRHERGLGTVSLDIGSRADRDVPAAGNVTYGIPPCAGTSATLATRVEYESRHSPEDGVEINADHERVAADAVERAMGNAEQRDVVLYGGWDEVGVGVEVGDHGAVRVEQAFCGSGPGPGGDGAGA